MKNRQNLIDMGYNSCDNLLVTYKGKQVRKLFAIPKAGIVISQGERDHYIGLDEYQKVMEKILDHEYGVYDDFEIVKEG